MINASKIYKMRIVFHLAPQLAGNMNRVGLLRNMILASGLPFVGAKQNPNVPRIAYGPSLKLGQSAQREYVDIYLLMPMDAQEVRKQLEASKPKGFTFLDVKRIPVALSGVQYLANVAVYEVQGEFVSYAAKQSFENFVLSARLNFTRQAVNGLRFTTDLKPFVRSGRVLSEQAVELTLNRVEDSWVNPLNVIYAWLGWEASLNDEDITDERFNVIRKGLYWADSAGNLHLI